MDLSSFVRRDISGIRRDILPLSGFGILSHALADEIAARNQAREGYFYTTDMEFLEEGEPDQQPMLPPVTRKPETVRMDMNILLKIVQESGENGKALPAGTQKVLERVRTILKAAPQSRPMSAPQTVQQTTQQRNIPLTQGIRSAPAMPSEQSVPSVLSAQAVQAAQPVSPMPRQMRAARPLPQNRMQNPLRDPKAPLTVERLHTPTHEVPRASDHAMLFSDVLHRAQDSGLTFAPRQGQGGVPASAQTRAAYTTQALRQARAEQQTAEAQNAPAWQRNALREASQTPPGAAGASWRFGETARNGDAVGAMAAMAAPRYPEAELNFVQEDTPQEGAEMPVSPVQHPGAESIRAVQEASAKALTETVRSALKEAAPLMMTTAPAETAPAAAASAAAAAAELKQAEQAEQKIAARTVQSASAEMAVRPARTESPAQTAGRPGQQTGPQQGGQMAAPGSQSNTVPQARQADQSTGTPRAKQAGRSIPPQTDSVVENREEEDQTENIENAGKAAEMSAATADENTAGTIETPIVKSEAQSEETANRQTEMSAGAMDAEHPGMAEYAGERIPALTGDRAFAQPPEEAADILRRMAAPRYPEAELNFVQEEAPQEGAEMPIPTVQHPNAESIRAVQEASAKALTETVRSVLKEATPLMTVPAATTAARNTRSAQNAQAMQTTPAGNAGQTVAHSGQMAAPVSQSGTVPQARQADQSTGTPRAQQADRNIPPRSDGMVEKREEENRAENAKNAEGTGKAAEMPAVTAAEYAAGTTETLARDRIPALTGDRTFVQTSEEAESLLSRVAASRYPEAELNFAQENAPQEGAEMPAAMAQHPGVESIRAVQEASAKALTETVRSALTDLRPGGELPGGSDTVHPAAGAGETESRLPPLSGGQMGSGPLDGQITGRFAGQNAGQNAGQAGGQTGGIERAVELLRQNGYGAPQLEYRMEDAGPEAPEMTQMSQTPELSRQAGAAAERSLLWLGEKVAANAARELSRMQRTMPSQDIRSGSASSAGSAVRRDQPGYPGGVSLSGQMDQKSQPGRAFRMMSHPTSQTAGWMGYRPIEMAHPAAQTPGWAAARPMGIPAEAQWKPGGQATPTVVSPAEMPSLMYQTGQAEGGEVSFVPTGNSAKTALPQPGSSLEAQSVYPALSMEYSSPMSRMEQQLQSTVAQQMSAASRPMGMQTEAGQYMAGKAAPGGMTTLDQMSAPPVNDQIVWQNPYLRSAPADMTYRSKKKPPEQPQPAPRPQTVRMSDAEIHRMADQVFRIVKDKIRQERRKMGL